MKKILVVDDAPEIGVLMEEILAPRGYQVETALNAGAALEKIRQNPPDLILLDIIMPGKNGYEFCKELKETVYRHIPIIMVSVKDKKEDIDRGLKAGAEDYMVKPFDPQDLLQRVKKYIK